MQVRLIMRSQYIMLFDLGVVKKQLFWALLLTRVI